jgi:hypothetical protein
MAAVSLSPTERSRKNVQVILQALASVGQNELAKAMGVHESTVSRFKDKEITTVGSALAHMGLKVVPVGVECFDPEYVEALRTLAARGIGAEPPKLDWSDAQ